MSNRPPTPPGAADAAPAIARRAGLLAAAAIALLAGLVFAVGVRAVLHQIVGGLGSLPAALAVHAVQLLGSALAWGALLRPFPGVWQMWRTRWVREATNSILPLGSLGGAVLGSRMLTLAGIAPNLAAASVTADITGELVGQVAFLLIGLAIAAGGAHPVLSWRWGLLVAGPLVLVVGSWIGSQLLGLPGWLERLAVRRLPVRWGRAMRGLQAQLAGIYRHPGRMAANVALNFASWSVGAAEVWVLLRGVGQPTSAGHAYAIEALGLVARSLAFAIPGGIAAQETGFVLACGLFGIPHQAGLAMSLLKRLRELLVGITGVLYWQWQDRRLWLR